MRSKERVRLGAEMPYYQECLNLNNGLSFHLRKGAQPVMPYNEWVNFSAAISNETQLNQDDENLTGKENA